jgi:adenylosuccinate synthase
VKGKAEVIIGAQWGDEGKGRIVDALADRVDVVVRYQGGANAGHTVIVEGEKHVFHLLPSGMLYPGKICVIGNGVVVDPDQFLAEIGELRERRKDKARLVISESSHVVMPYHKVIDEAEEKRRSKGRKIGTTKRGIGPCYADKVNRIGIRVGDLLDPDLLRDKIIENLEIKNLFLTRIFNESPIPFEEVMEKAISWGRLMSPYIGDGAAIVNDALDRGRGVLFEGAQGTLLDVDHGTYPFVTSSSASAGGACIGTGVGPTRIDRVLGVAKAYCTRVGEGPFPTEDLGEVGERLREAGGEYGATTGRPRRCGWLDMVALRYAVRVNGLGGIALTKLDVLTGLPRIKVCTAYEIGNKRFDILPARLPEKENMVLHYEELKGWSEDISECRRVEELPPAARDMVRFIEEKCGIPIVLIGVGSGREQTILSGL